MLIGIDGNEANVESRVGSNVYAYELLYQLYNLSRKRKDIRFRIYLKNPPLKSLPLKTHYWNYAVFGPPKAWTQYALPSRLYFEKTVRQAPKVFFTPGHYSPRKSPVKTVISIMDLAFLKFANEFTEQDLKKLTNWTEYSVKNASHIFTISQSSKYDLEKYYRVNPEKISVFYPGFNINYKRTQSDNSYQSLRVKHGINQPYILYVGTIQPRKNLERLFEAFIHITRLTNYKNLQLIIVGKKGWLYENIIKKVRDLDLTDKVIFTGFVSDFEKGELMRYARMLVLPSLYEGFGLPVLEAMAQGTPVVASRVSSLPEIIGSEGMYIENPLDVMEIEKSIFKMLQLPDSKRTELIAGAKKQAQKFSWENCGEQTLKILLKIAEEK
jgi:glycosyltransferase involved in cell wall biosynthesis